MRPDRMRENLGVVNGLLLAENVTTVTARELGKPEDHELVKVASHRNLALMIDSLMMKLGKEAYRNGLAENLVHQCRRGVSS